METKRFPSIWNHHEFLSELFPIHLNTYVMGLRPLEIFVYAYSAGIDFKVYPRTVSVKSEIHINIKVVIKIVLKSVRALYLRL